MQLKRFVAPTMSQALKQVREEVGSDAVILSNKRVAEGVELVTAVDQPDPDASGVFPLDMQPNQPVKQEPSASKLELEVDRMQSEAKQRAAALAATLGQQEQTAFAQAMARQQAPKPPTANHSQAQNKPKNDSLQADNKEVIEAAVAAALAQYAKTQDEQTAQEDPQVIQMRSELQAMRHLLEQQLSSMAWGQFASNDPERASLWRRLKRMGIEAKIADKLLNEIPDLKAHKHVWMQLMQNLSKDLPVIGEDLIAQGGIYCLVGPTGAGKTTSIAKLAAKYVMEHGADSIALVTTDTYRIAAHEQLRTVGRILNVPVKIVDKQNPLDRVLYALRHKQLVLVDTAGLTAQDERLLKQTESINELADKVKTVLVLPTTSQPQVLKAAYHHYKTDNLAACILTKLDETASLGACLSLAVEKMLPIAYSTDGQNIPDDINVAEAIGLVRCSINLAKDNSVDDGDMSEELQSLIG